MSLETEIKNLAAAVIALTAKIEGINVAPAAPVAQVAAPVVPVVPQMPAAPVAAPAPVMPAAPSFVAPVAAPAPIASGAPFTDGAGLIQYVMGVYKEIGATKGAQIQGVLTGLGYANINDVKPEHYIALFAGVEALKA